MEALVTFSDGCLQEGNDMKKEKKVAFFVRKSDEALYSTCLESLQALHLPAGYEAELFTLAAGKPYAVQANKALALSDAKYKIYINDDMCLVQPRLFGELLAIFKNTAVGMVGAWGSQSLPVDGNVLSSVYKRGAVYVPAEDGFSELRFGDATGKAADVRCILPSFFATQWDIAWDESYEKQYYAVLAHCRAFEEEGRRIVVPLPKNIWCAYQVKDISFDGSEVDRKKFFTRYHSYIDGTEPKGISTLYACGEGSEIPSWKEFSHPEGIAVGRETHIHKTAMCRLVMSNFAGKPRIIVGDHCEIGAGSTLAAVNRIVLENTVRVAENVHIKDYVYDDRDIGLSFKDRAIIAAESGIQIERGVRIEENVLIRGAVHIGRGSIVRAGSTVESDIPAYCIAEGTPARVVAAFSPKAGKWMPTAGEKALERVRAEREKTPPLLTVAFITYNRSEYLKKSLRCVLQQLGNDELAEVLVSDNVSTDDTKAFVQKMQKTYRNLRYHCNEENIGAEGNIHRAIQESKGEYVLVAGDDDYFADGALLFLLSNIVQYRGSALFFLGNNFDSYDVQRGSGCAEYIASVGFFVTWISGIVLQRTLYDLIENPQKYDDTHIPQVYLQIEILKRNPKFVVLYGTFILKASGDRAPAGVNFAEVFIKHYLDMLQFEAKIPQELLSAEKKRLMENHVYPWLARIRGEHIDVSLDGFFDIVEAYYKDEPYYEDVLATLNGIVQITGSEM